jgi:hypothetical protein
MSWEVWILLRYRASQSSTIIFFYSRFEVQLFSGVLAENCLPKTYAPQDLLLIKVKKKKSTNLLEFNSRIDWGLGIWSYNMCIFFFSTALKIQPLQSSVPQESNTNL